MAVAGGEKALARAGARNSGPVVEVVVVVVVVTVVVVVAVVAVVVFEVVALAVVVVAVPVRVFGGGCANRLAE